MKSNKKKGCLTGCLTICLWIVVFSIYLSLAISAFAFYGFSFGILGTFLALTNPAYRKWLRNQRGFKYRLSKLPGLQTNSPVTLAVATAIYIFSLSLLSWAGIEEIFSDATTALITAFIGLIGVVVLFSQFILGWGISESNQETQEEKQGATEEAQYFERIERLNQMKQLDPIAFERFVGSLFERMAYQVETTATTGDEGIDLILRKGATLAIVQCKRYEGSVGQPVVRDLYGVMVHNQAEEAYLVTTGTITLPAQEWARGKPIHLVDGNILVKWIESFEEVPEEEPDTEETLSDVNFFEVIKSMKIDAITIGIVIIAMLFPIIFYLTGSLLFFQQSSTTPEIITTTPKSPTETIPSLSTIQPATPQIVTQSSSETPSPLPTQKTPTATPTSLPTATNTPGPSPTSTPTNSPTPTPTATPSYYIPNEFLGQEFVLLDECGWGDNCGKLPAELQAHVGENAFTNIDGKQIEITLKDVSLCSGR